MNCVGVGAGRAAGALSLARRDQRRRDGRRRRQSGWPPSSAAARSEDGRGPKTELERLVPGALRARDPGRARTCDARGHDRAGAGSASSRRSSSRRRTTDAVAAEIVDRQAAEVVAFVRAACTGSTSPASEVEVVLGGGVLQSGQRGACSAGSRRACARSGRSSWSRVARSRPIVGAALLGLDRLGAPPRRYERAPRGARPRDARSGGDVAGDAAAVPELP